MDTNCKRAIKKRKGNIMFALLAALVIVLIVSCIAGAVLTVDAIQKANIVKLNDRYEIYSIAELAAYELVDDVAGKKVESINIENIKNTVESNVSAILEKPVSVEIVDKLEIDLSMQVKVTDGQKSYVIEISGFEIDTDGEHPEDMSLWTLNIENVYLERFVEYI